MRKLLKTAAIIMGCLALGAGGYGMYLYQSVKDTAERIYEERLPAESVFINSDPVVAQSVTADLDQREPFTVLMLGVDQRANDRGRSDAMILLSVNPARKSILMFNIPRDTLTPIAGREKADKINHAYAFGGVDMSVRTVETFLQFPVNYYVKVNMEGFSNIIDAIGGVQVENTLDFNYEGYHFAKGTLRLNGKEALAFSRMRYEDPRGDLGRNSRQREIVKEALNSALKISTVFKLESLLAEVDSSVKTDLTFEDMKRFVTDYRQDLERIEQVEIHGTGRTIGGVWYYLVDSQERQRIHALLKEHMQRG